MKGVEKSGKTEHCAEVILKMRIKHTYLVIIVFFVLSVVGLTIAQAVYINLLHSRYAIEIASAGNSAKELQAYWCLKQKWPDPTYIHDDSYFSYVDTLNKNGELIYRYKTGFNKRIIEFTLSDEGQLFVKCKQRE